MQRIQPAPRIERSVFLSYRRVNVPWALAVYQDLTQHGFDVFFDYQSVGPGKFESIILGNIVSRAHFVLLLTPSALERCDEPGDWLRREIETAIESERNIVPLLMDNFDFGAPSVSSRVTGRLSALPQFNGLPVYAKYFFPAMEELRTQFLSVPVATYTSAAEPEARQAATEQKKIANAAPDVPENVLQAQQYYERAYAVSDSDEQIRLTTEAIRLVPDFAEAFHRRGTARHNKGDLEGAILDYNEAARLKPNDALSYLAQGRVHAAKGEMNQAISHYVKAISLKPDYADAYNSRGIACQAESDLDGAIADFDQAIQLKPNDAIAFYNRGNARKDKGDLNGAIADYNQAIQLKPDYAVALNNRGIARKNNGDHDGAIADYNEAIRLKPDYATAFYNRGIAREAKGDLDGAAADYTRAIQLKPDYADAFNNRGNAREAKGDLDGAIADYNQAIQLKPDDAFALYNRGIARQAKGDLGGAIADYQKYLDLGGGERAGATEQVKQHIRALQSELESAGPD